MLIARMLGKVDVEANLRGGGEMAQAGAMRYGIAHTMIPLVDADIRALIRAGKYKRNIVLFQVSL